MRKGRFHSSSLLRQLALGHPFCEVACLLQLVWLMGLSIQRFKKSLRFLGWRSFPFFDSFALRDHLLSSSVGVTELTEAKQRQHESVDDFIAIWINLELSCEQEFFEAQQLKMCINCFRYELSLISIKASHQYF